MYNKYEVISTGINRTGEPSTDGLVLNINFDNSSVLDVSGNDNHGTNNGATFGYVSKVMIDLVEGVDYQIVGSLFTILNPQYSWNAITTSWDYDDITRERGFEDIEYMNSQLGEDGLVSWVSAIIALTIGMFFIGVLVGKGKRTY